MRWKLKKYLEKEVFLLMNRWCREVQLSEGWNGKNHMPKQIFRKTPNSHGLT